jgi:hypothetical protein
MNNANTVAERQAADLRFLERAIDPTNRTTAILKESNDAAMKPAPALTRCTCGSLYCGPVRCRFTMLPNNLPAIPTDMHEPDWFETRRREGDYDEEPEAASACTELGT